MDGHQDLTRAPWYPSQAGDRLVVTFGELGDLPGWTETYEVVASSEPGPGPDGQNELRLTGHTAPEDNFAGGFGGTPEMRGSDAIETACMEVGSDGAMSAAVVIERDYTPAQYEELEEKVIARGAELAARWDQEQQDSSRSDD